MPKIMKKVRKFHKSEKSCEKVLTTVFKNHLISSRFECSITKVRLNLHYREIVTRMTMKIGNLRSSIDFSETLPHFCVTHMTYYSEEEGGGNILVHMHQSKCVFVCRRDRACTTCTCSTCQSWSIHYSLGSN